MGKRHRVLVRREYDAIQKGPYKVVYGGTASDYIGDKRWSTSEAKCSPGDPDWEERLTAAITQAKERHAEWHLKQRSGRKSTRRAKKGTKVQLSSIDRLRWSRNVTIYVAVAVAAFASANQFHHRNWLLGTLWAIIWLSWFLGMFVTLKADRLMEDLYGHRGDAEDDQSSAAERTEDGADEVAASGAIPIPTTGIYAIGGTFTPGPVAQAAGASVVTGIDPAVPETDRTEELELEVYTAPVWGFREWNIVDGPIPSLASPQQGLIWRPGKNTARCNSGYETVNASGTTSISFSHEAPQEGCWCGFHALRDLLDATRYDGHVIGGVVGWGKIVDGETGWRSEHIAVAALLDRPIFIEDHLNSQGYPYIMGSALQTKIEYVANLYNVPLCHSIEELMEKTEGMAKWMAGEDLAEDERTAG